MLHNTLTVAKDNSDELDIMLEKLAKFCYLGDNYIYTLFDI